MRPHPSRHLIASAVFVVACCPAAAVETRPRLAVTPAEIPALRERALQDPWKAIAQGVPTTSTRTYPVAGSILQRCDALSDIMSGSSLGYLLAGSDSERTTYRQRIIAGMSWWDPAVTGNLSAHLQEAYVSGSWERYVPTANAFFHSVIAFDVIHADLDAGTVADIGADLAIPGGFYTGRRISHVTAGLAARGIWALHQGDMALAATTAHEYLEDTKGWMSPDGPFMEGPGYGLARFMNPNRELKAMFGCLAVDRGLISNDEWYGDPTIQGFFEWLNGYSCTPAGKTWVVGDTGAGSGYASWMANARMAARFTPLAGAYEAHLKKTAVPTARLTSFLYTATSAIAARPAPSRIFPGAGAYLRETRGTSEDLAAVLHNLRDNGNPHGHVHKEVNAVVAAAHGQTLLSGAGYPGWGGSYGGFVWNYFTARAVSANTAFIDYDPYADGGTDQSPAGVNDHRTGPLWADTMEGRAGGGVRGIIGGPVELAMGDSLGLRTGGRAAGTWLDALPNGNHRRTLLQVQPDGGRAGYWVVGDVLAAAPGYRPQGATLACQTVWRPATTSIAVVRPGELIRWSFGTPLNPVGLAIHLGTPPIRTRTPMGAMANQMVAPYLLSDYAMDAASTARIVTVLHPHSTARPLPALTRIGSRAAGWTGSRIDADADTVDMAVEVGAPAAVVVEGAAVRADLLWFRRTGGTVTAMAGSGVRTAVVDGTGFVSELPIALVLGPVGSGAVIMPQAGSLTVHDPDGRTLWLDGDSAPLAPTATGPGWVRVSLPAGSHRFTLANPVANTAPVMSRPAAAETGGLVLP